MERKGGSRIEEETVKSRSPSCHFIFSADVSPLSSLLCPVMFTFCPVLPFTFLIHFGPATFWPSSVLSCPMFIPVLRFSQGSLPVGSNFLHRSPVCCSHLFCHTLSTFVPLSRVLSRSLIFSLAFSSSPPCLLIGSVGLFHLKKSPSSSVQFSSCHLFFPLSCCLLPILVLSSSFCPLPSWLFNCLFMLCSFMFCPLSTSLVLLSSSVLFCPPVVFCLLLLLLYNLQFQSSLPFCRPF